MRKSVTTTAAVLLAAMLLAACSGGGVRKEPAPAEGDRNPQAALVNTQLGSEYLRMGDLQQANEKLERALVQDPEYHAAHLTYAMLQERLGQFDVAERHYRRAIALRPNDSESHNNYGIFLCRRDRVAEAEDAFRKALENPLYLTPEAALMNLGLCVLKTGDLARAEAYFMRSADADPRYAPPLLELAELTLAEGRPEDARRWLRRYSDQFPEAPRSLWLCVRIERALDNRRAADRCSLRLRSLYSGAPEATLLRDLESRDE